MVAEQHRLETLADAALRKGSVAEHNRIIRQANALVPTVEEVTSMTQGLKNARGALRRFNTPVYDAATQTMRYAAFFRYVKGQNPGAWRSFVHEVESVSIQPPVVTPTRWAR